VWKNQLSQKEGSPRSLLSLAMTEIVHAEARSLEVIPGVFPARILLTLFHVTGINTL
jgi:hypothetical protein